MKKTFLSLLAFSIALHAVLGQEIPPHDWPPTCNSKTVLNIKVFLDGVDESTCTMPTALKSEPNFPLTDPYWADPYKFKFHHHNSYLDIRTAMIQKTIQDNPVVDWVFIELRSVVPYVDSSDPDATVDCDPEIYTKVGFLLEDGSLIDLDGSTGLTFNCSYGNSYYVIIRHRNHLSICTENPVSITPGQANYLDFTALPGSPGYIEVHQEGSIMKDACSNNLRKMAGGDANSDDSVDAFDTPIWNMQNGNFDNYMDNADYNLDGSVDAFDSIIWELDNGLFSEYRTCPNNAQNRIKSSPALAAGDRKYVKISPNPSNGHTLIRFVAGMDQNTIVRLKDAQGKSLFVGTIATHKGENNYALDMSRFAQGIYWLNIQNEEGNSVMKLVKN